MARDKRKGGVNMPPPPCDGLKDWKRKKSARFDPHAALEKFRERFKWAVPAPEPEPVGEEAPPEPPAPLPAPLPRVHFQIIGGEPVLVIDGIPYDPLGGDRIMKMWWERHKKQTHNT